jgi:hypothetical protein
MDRLVRIIFVIVLLALIALSIWLPSLLPVNWRAIIGWIGLSGLGIGGVILLVAWIYATAMRS